MSITQAAKKFTGIAALAATLTACDESGTQKLLEQRYEGPVIIQLNRESVTGAIDNFALIVRDTTGKILAQMISIQTPMTDSTFIRTDNDLYVIRKSTFEAARGEYLLKPYSTQLEQR